MPDLRIQLLGPVRAWRGEAELDLGSARQRAVLAILALRPNQVVSREELIDGVWGEHLPAKATGILYTYIWGLRHALEPPRRKQDAPTVLTSPGSGYSLILDDEHIDERLFDRHHNAAQRHWERGAPRPTIAELEAALALWHGEALGGLTGPAVELNRTRLNEVRLATFERLAELKIVVGDNSGAIADLQGLVAEYPLREGPVALLMTALYRAGRRAEALDVFTNAQRLLVTELGIESSRTVQRIHAKILANEPVAPQDFDASMPAIMAASPPTPGFRDPPDVALPEPPAPPEVFVGRTAELAWLRSLVAGLAAGRGGCGWIDGEPGIGKSALLATALAGAPAFGQRTAWLVGEQLIRQAPPPERPSTIDPRLAGVDRTLALIERLCATTPLVIVVDEFQETDETGRLLWRRATRLTQQLPLVLIGVCRTIPHTEELEHSRDAVIAVGGHARTLGPLEPDAVAELAARRLGAAPAPSVRPYLDDAMGNPAYLNELLNIVRRGAAPEPEAEPNADADAALGTALTRMLIRHIGFLTPETRDMLRWAALLGSRFDLAQVATVMHTSPAELVAAVEEATVAGVLVATDQGLEFRNSAVARALYREHSAAVRQALHREAAETLADAQAPVEDVAAQLLFAAPAFDPWALRWLMSNIDAVGTRDPFLAVDLLDQAVTLTHMDAEDRERLAVRRVRWLFHLGRRPETEARDVLSTTTDAEHAAEMRWVLSQLIHDAGQLEVALADLRDAEHNPSVPGFWKARYKILRARFERTGLDDLRTASRTATAALEDATRAADPVAMSDAMHELWYFETVQRDHAAALLRVDGALAATTGLPDLARWQLHLLDNRVFTLQNLDRLDEASDVLARMRVLSARIRPPARRHHVAAAVHYYWLGRWDEALAEIAAFTEEGRRETEYLDLGPPTPLLELGVAAIIAGQRGDDEALDAYLRAARAHPIATVADQESSDFLLMARAMDVSRRDGVEAELAELDFLLDLKYGRTTLRHQWLPALVRLAVEADCRTRVKAALEVAEIEAAQENPPARAHTALAWCRGLVGSDPAALLAVAAHFRGLGRAVEMAATLVDAAAALARHDDLDHAARTFGEALTVLNGLRAARDVARAVRRMGELGVCHSYAAIEQPMMTGWHSLSELEQRIAELASSGMTNPQLAVELTMSRRDVHAHLSRVMQKLGAGSREELTEMMATARADTTDARPSNATEL